MAESHCNAEVPGFSRKDCGSSIVPMRVENSSDGMKGQQERLDSGMNWGELWTDSIHPTVWKTRKEQVQILLYQARKSCLLPSSLVPYVLSYKKAENTLFNMTATLNLGFHMDGWMIQGITCVDVVKVVKGIFFF